MPSCLMRSVGIQARMAKLADAADLKSVALRWVWGFKSPSGHQSGHQQTIENKQIRNTPHARLLTPQLKCSLQKSDYGYNSRYSAGTSPVREVHVASIIKTPSGKWKAIIRKAGWPLTVKTFRTQRDASDWARRTEDEMVRGAFIKRASSDRMTVAVAMQRYLADVVPTKRPTSQDADRRRSRIIHQAPR